MARGLPPDVVIPASMPPAERLRLFRRLAEEGRAAVRPLLAQHRAGLVGLSTAARAAWALAFLWDLVLYQPDAPRPDGSDTATPPARLLAPLVDRPVSPVTGQPKGAGDCEDLAILLAAILAELRVPWRIDWLEQPGSAENHVSVEVRTADGWQWADPSVEGAEIGEHPYAAARRMGMVHRAELGAQRA